MKKAWLSPHRHRCTGVLTIYLAVIMGVPAHAMAADPDLAHALEVAAQAVRRANDAAKAARDAADNAHIAAQAAEQASEVVARLSGAPLVQQAQVMDGVARASAIVPAQSGATSHPVLPSAQAVVPPAPWPVGAATQKLDINFSGYIRTGAGGNNKGGRQTCFGLPGMRKYRFGNECETFAELQPSMSFPVRADGVRATYTFMLGYYSTSPDAFTGSEPSTFDVRQNWIGLTGFHGLLEGATVWGGRRYYQRHDVHLNDFFYWSQRAQGVGVENMTTPLGNLSVALMRSYNDAGASSDRFTNGASGTSLDVRLSRIPVNPNGTLELGAEYRGTAREGDYSARSGFLLTAEHVQTGILGGKNVFTVQYGQGSGANLSTGDSGAYVFSADHTNAFRLIEQAVFEPTPDFSIAFDAVFERTTNFRLSDRLIKRRDWLSFGARPEWHWSDHLTSLIDLGFDNVHYGDDPSGVLSGAAAKMFKVSVAPIVLKMSRGFGDRPELRLFGTCARWNRAADLLAVESGNISGNITGDGNYLGDRKGCSFGAQIEAWW